MEQYTITSPFKHEETFFSQFETEDIHLEGWLQAGLINDDSGYVDMYFNTHTKNGILYPILWLIYICHVTVTDINNSEWCTISQSLAYF